MCKLGGWLQYCSRMLLLLCSRTPFGPLILLPSSRLPPNSHSAQHIKKNISLFPQRTGSIFPAEREREGYGTKAGLSLSETETGGVIVASVKRRRYGMQRAECQRKKSVRTPPSPGVPPKGPMLTRHQMGTASYEKHHTAQSPSPPFCTLPSLGHPNLSIVRRE